jgi:hypothetical protein
VEGPACKHLKDQGLLKEIGSAEPWIFDPTAEGAVDPAVGAVHKATVDRSLNAKGYAPQTVHRRSKGPGRVRVGCGGDVAGDRGGAAAPRRGLAGVPYIVAQGAISRARGLYA